jgi:hypothetical protein
MEVALRPACVEAKPAAFSRSSRRMLGRCRVAVPVGVQSAVRTGAALRSHRLSRRVAKADEFIERTLNASEVRFRSWYPGGSQQP